jgi:hypothetical protein
MSSTPAVKQYKALGDDVWKSKVDKIVSAYQLQKKKKKK